MDPVHDPAEASTEASTESSAEGDTENEVGRGQILLLGFFAALILVPVTLPVPVLREFVQDRFKVGAFAVAAFHGIGEDEMATRLQHPGNFSDDLFAATRM